MDVKGLIFWWYGPLVPFVLNLGMTVLLLFTQRKWVNSPIKTAMLIASEVFPVLPIVCTFVLPPVPETTTFQPWQVSSMFLLIAAMIFGPAAMIILKGTTSGCFDKTSILVKSIIVNVLLPMTAVIVVRL